jgi:hypothetical protein
MLVIVPLEALLDSFLGLIARYQALLQSVEKPCLPLYFKQTHCYEKTIEKYPPRLRSIEKPYLPLPLEL